MKKARSIVRILFLTTAIILGFFLAAVAQEYDAANDLVSESLAKSIANARCLTYFGKKQLFDVEKYFDGTGAISAYCFVYSGPNPGLLKSELLEILRSNPEKRLDTAEYASVVISASKTHMPVIEWSLGFPDSYYLAAEIAEMAKIPVADLISGKLRFYYLGPASLYASIDDHGIRRYYDTKEGIKEIDQARFPLRRFRSRTMSKQDERAKLISPALIGNREDKIQRSWDISTKVVASLNQTGIPSGSAAPVTKALSHFPYFLQTEFKGSNNIFPMGDSCQVMACGDAIAYYDVFQNGNLWNLVDYSWFEREDDFVTGGFYDDKGLTATKKFIKSIADAIGYRYDLGGTPRDGVQSGLTNFTNSAAFGNNLYFTVGYDGDGCTYEELQNEIVGNRPIILGFSPPEGGNHAVAIYGVDTQLNRPDLSEPILIRDNQVAALPQYSYEWIDYNECDDRATWTVHPGGYPGDIVNPPTLEAPENADIISDNTPLLNWADASGATSYRLLVTSGGDFGTIVLDVESPVSQYQVPAALADGYYVWRVAPKNSYGNWCNFSGGYSFIINITTISIQTDTETLSIPEEGTRTFQVKLSSQPPASVAVAVARSGGDSDISVSAGTSLSFTTSNWSTWKTVTLSAAKDADAASGQAIISLTASGLSTKNVTAVEEDDDAIAFNTGFDRWSVDEGSNQVCGVRLTAQPTSTVTAYVVKQGGDSSISIISGSTLTFTTSNWNTWHDVTFSAAQDADADNGTANYRIYATGIPDKYMPVVEQDDETMAFEIEGGITSITVPEGGISTFRARLTAQPISDYMVSVFRRFDTDDSDIIVQSGYSMAFTSANYQSYQTITLAALDDVDCANGQAEIRLKGVGIDKIYKSVQAAEVDNDTMGILASTNSLSVSEGGTSSFEVRLSNQPTSDLILSVARSDGDGDISVQSGASLTFTSVNWGSFQQVTLAAAEDADSAAGSATIRVSGPGLTNKDVIVTEADNDGVVLYPEIIIRTPLGVEIPDGGTYDFGDVTGSTQVALQVENLGDASLTLNDGSMLSVTVYGADNGFFLAGLSQATIPPDSSATLTIHFSPVTIRSYMAHISLGNNDSNESPYDITFTGTRIPSVTLPTLTTSAATSVTSINAIGGGTVTSDGGAMVTARGVCWNTAGSPTISNTHTTDGAGTGSYVSSLVGLSPSTTYYVRGYAANSVGTAYGGQVQFTTLSSPEPDWEGLGSGTNGYVRAMAASGDSVYVGGEFTTAGGVAVNYVAKWDGSTWTALGSGMNGAVQTLVMHDGALYAGGNFTMAGGVTANYIAKWDGSTWSALGSGMNSTVGALVFMGDTLYAGGVFNNAGGQSASKIARWDGANWHALGTGMNSNVWALAATETTLYAGGNFTTAGGVSASYVAAWNGASWSALGSGTNNFIYALKLSGDVLYVGGIFTTAGGASARRIAKWESGGWAAMGAGFNGGGSDGVQDLEIRDGRLYAGGSLWDEAGTTQLCVFAWDGETWTAFDSIPGWVADIELCGNWIYAGGGFTTAGGTSANNIVRWPLSYASPSKVDFNGDGQEDILWRYYGTGGYNRAWFLGNSEGVGLPLSSAGSAKASTSVKNSTSKSRASLAILSDPREAGMKLNKGGKSAEADSQDLMGDTVRSRAMVDDPRRAGNGNYEPSHLRIADPRQVKLAVRAEASSDAQAAIASVPSLLGGADIMAVGDLNWQIVGTGDFNKDTHVDILWRNVSSGVNVVWYMNGPEWSSSAELIPVADLTWQIVGTGDFNKDGSIDLLWRNSSSGANVVWYMNGSQWSGSADLLGVSDTTWKIVGTGDFNKDGNVDILWRNTLGGWNVVWYLNNATWIGTAELIQVGDQAWEIMGTGDFNKDGNVDILWRNGVSGSNVIWYMNGAGWIGSAELIPVADLNWKIVSR
jgi:hypothetical protein